MTENVKNFAKFFGNQTRPKNEKKSTDKLKHVVFLESNKLFDGVSNLEDFNKFSDLSLFIDHPLKIRNVERSITHNSLPSMRPDGQGRTLVDYIIFIICHVIHLCSCVRFIICTLFYMVTFSPTTSCETLLNP